MTQQPWPQYTPPRRNRAALFVVLGVVAALVIAGAVAVVLVLSDPVDRAEPGPSADDRFTAARDDAQQAGEEAAAVFNTLDYQTVDADLDRWESYATGDLLTELKDKRESSEQALRQAKSKTTAEVLAAALSELDTKKGTARMIAAVQVTVSQDGGAPTEKRIRLRLTLTETSEGWKASEIGQVPVDG